jgi:transcriptional regulator GlxA family with amidase domain
MEYAFREALGQSPYQYIRRRRLKLAQQLLEKDARAKIYEVARQTGFSSAKQFSMAFSQEFGSSPREYQRTRSQ